MLRRGPETLFWNLNLIYSYPVNDYSKHWKAWLWPTRFSLEKVEKEIYAPQQVFLISAEASAHHCRGWVLKLGCNLPMDSQCELSWGTDNTLWCLSDICTPQGFVSKSPTRADLGLLVLSFKWVYTSSFRISAECSQQCSPCWGRVCCIYKRTRFFFLSFLAMCKQ